MKAGDVVRIKGKDDEYTILADNGDTVTVIDFSGTWQKLQKDLLEVILE